MTLKTILGVALAVACVANPGLAQTQATNATPSSADESQSTAAMAQQATNPFSSAWLMQIQQNNNWIDMPLGHGDRMQSNLQFQPLMSLRLTDQWGLYLRPVLTTVNSLPHLGQNGDSDRSTG